MILAELLHLCNSSVSKDGEIKFKNLTAKRKKQVPRIQELSRGLNISAADTTKRQRRDVASMSVHE